MTKARPLMVTGILTLFPASAFVTPPPFGIYRLAGARIVKADHQGNGELEYEAELSAHHVSVPTLAKKVIAHAHSKGFRVVEFKIKRDDADLKFRRGHRELDVSIESKGRERIEYRADLDLNRQLPLLYQKAI